MTLSLAQWKRLEKSFVVLVAIHSYAVMLFLIFLTRWGVHFGGWAEITPLFFARQSGVFHGIVATAYLLEYHRHGTMGLLLLAKSTAVVFLTSMLFFDPVAWSIPLSALGDGSMALAAWIIRRKVGQARS